MGILLLYGTSEGQTRKVAAYVADRLRERGHQVALVDVQHQPRDLRLAEFDAAIIAARVHAGAYQRGITRFIRRNRRILKSMPNAFLSVSMSAANLRPGDAERAAGYVAALVRRTRWIPGRTLQVAGARLYTRHNAIGRWILGIVDRHQLDTGKDHVWTDWAELARFAGEFAATLAVAQGSTAPPALQAEVYVGEEAG